MDQAISTDTRPERERRVSFTFAKRHGVLVSGIENGIARTVYRADASPLSVAELRRFRQEDSCQTRYPTLNVQDPSPLVRGK
jgi:hypothetical protein